MSAGLNENLISFSIRNDLCSQKVTHVKEITFNTKMNGDVDQNDKYLTVCEICYAVRDVVGRESYIDGAQRIGGL